MALTSLSPRQCFALCLATVVLQAVLVFVTVYGSQWSRCMSPRDTGYTWGLWKVQIGDYDFPYTGEYMTTLARLGAVQKVLDSCKVVGRASLLSLAMGVLSIPVRAVGVFRDMSAKNQMVWLRVATLFLTVDAFARVISAFSWVFGAMPQIASFDLLQTFRSVFRDSTPVIEMLSKFPKATMNCDTQWWQFGIVGSVIEIAVLSTTLALVVFATPIYRDFSGSWLSRGPSVVQLSSPSSAGTLTAA